MLGNIYRNYNERIKVLSKSGINNFKCKKWLNGKTEEIKLKKKELTAMQYICTIN